MLSDRNALLYLGGMGLSAFGSSVFALTAGVWVMVLTDSDALAGLVSFCVWGSALASPLFGVLADRVRRRRLVIVTSVLIAAALLTLFAVDGPGDVWLVFTVMTGYGFTVAGGGVLALIDAVTFAASASAFAAIRVADVPRGRDGSSWHVELREGLRHVLGNAELRTLLVTCGLVLTLFGIRTPTAFAIVEQGLDRAPTFVGVLGAAQGVGSVTGGIVAIRLLRTGRERGFAVAGMIVAAVGALLLCTTSSPAVVAGTGLTGVGLPWLLVASATKVQLSTPPDLQGRAASISHLLLFAGMTLGMPVGSALAGFVDYRLVLLAFTVVGAGCAYVLWRRGRPNRRSAGDNRR